MKTSSSNSQHDIDERTNLTSKSMFELLLFRLGTSPGTDKRELFGINVFKVREIMVMPQITTVVNAGEHIMGVANIRGQLIPVINLPALTGCNPKQGLSILLVTEFARTTQAFAVEEVNEIVRLEWKHVLSAEHHGGRLVTSLARVDGAVENTRIAQVLDVEQILRDVMPVQEVDDDITKPLTKITLPPGSVILAADDSAVARMLIEQGLKGLNVPYIMTKTGAEAWTKLEELYALAQKEGVSIQSKTALILTDLEMPEMDGFTLTRKIKGDERFKMLPVIIHSSLTGAANEGHVKSVGADGYVAKFAADELSASIAKALQPK